MTFFCINKSNNKRSLIKWIITPILAFATITCIAGESVNKNSINRKVLIEGHNPSLTQVDPVNPFTLGNGQFAFTADVTGLQSLPELYYNQGTPIETKARWAWHTRKNPNVFTLKDTNQKYSAYGVTVPFPTNMDGEAGQWLRMNPHDLPLAKLGLILNNEPIKVEQLGQIQQTLNLWEGKLSSHYTLQNQTVTVETAVHGQRDIVSANIHSTLLSKGQLAISLQFPRGYLLDKKNTPDMDWSHANEHHTHLMKSTANSAVFLRTIDSAQHTVILHWKGQAQLEQHNPHSYVLTSTHTKNQDLEISLEFIQADQKHKAAENFQHTLASAKQFWNNYWTQGAILSLAKSTHTQAKELERRIILSQYLMGVQAQGKTPTQETGLTSSSWYGKHHTEMMWWHTAHWIYWGRPEQANTVLTWYRHRLKEAQKTAQERGLSGARWAKMVGPEGRESPGGNPLIIWNQPQPIHLAELLYTKSKDPNIILQYQALVEETAKAISSMLVWEEEQQRFSLLPPIWIAQEIYPATQSKNPSFELSYWRYGLTIAQEWRKRLGKKPNALWQKQLQQLAALPIKDDKYVAIESIPDTFDNIDSRQDHPTILAPWGLLQDPTVDTATMQKTFDAVLQSWDWKKKIWGWDYPMIAMTALQLGHTELAFELLLKDAPHNHYLINGHCPQAGANLPVYLPANGALLSTMAMIVNKWPQQPASSWQIQAEGF